MGATLIHYNLEIILDGAPSRFKVAAEDESAARKACEEYFAPKTVVIKAFNPGPWTPEGFKK